MERAHRRLFRKEQKKPAQAIRNLPKKRAPGKVCASKAFWEEEAQWSERTGGFSNRNKKAGASDTELAPTMACPGRFELPVFRIGIYCIIQLCYGQRWCALHFSIFILHAKSVAVKRKMC